MAKIATSDSDSSTTPTETTMNRHTSPDPPPPHDPPSQSTASRQAETPAPEATRQYQPRDDTIRVLVLGRSGSGKTHIIQTLCDEPERPVVGRLSEATTTPSSKIVVMKGSTRDYKFELIDTPGFDNMNMSDTEVYVRIAEYLQDP
ncbi:50S ribosome-binding GTPase, partial [Rhizoctonia solani AG-3 Rhs1AP]